MCDFSLLARYFLQMLLHKQAALPKINRTELLLAAGLADVADQLLFFTVTVLGSHE